MAETETIKDFLVSLGFKIDEHSQSRFTEALEGATLKGNLFADVLVEGAKKGIDALERMLTKLNETAQTAEKLFFNVQQINQDTGLKETTLGLRAFSEALDEVHMSGGNAIEVMKGFADWLKANREGRAAYIKENFKIDITGLSGEDAMMQVWEKIGKDPNLRRLGPEFAKIMGMGNLSPDMLGWLEGLTKTPEGKTFQDIYKANRDQQTAAGLTDEKMKAAAEAAEAFNSAMSKLNTAFTDLEVDILAYLIPDLKWIDDWLKAHPSPEKIVEGTPSLIESIIKGGIGVSVGGHHWGDVPVPDEKSVFEDPGKIWRGFNWIWDNFKKTWGIGQAKADELPPGAQPKAGGAGQWLADQFSGAAKFIGIGASGAEVSPANPLPVKIMSVDPQAALQSGAGGSDATAAAVASAGGGAGGARGGGFSPIDPAQKFSGTQQDVARIIASAFRKGGASEEGVAAVLANSADESSLDPTRKGAAGEIGLWQFSPTGAELGRYMSWLKKNHPGSNWADPHLQASFMVENLKENYGPLWQELTTHSPAGWLGAEVVTKYEHPRADLEAMRRNRYLGGVPSVQHYTGPMGPEAPEDPAGGVSVGVSPRAPPPIYRRRNIYHGGQSSEYPSPHEIVGGGVSLLDHSAAAMHYAASSGGGGGFGGTISTQNHITINTPDAVSAGAMVGLHLDRNAADVARNLQGSFA